MPALIGLDEPAVQAGVVPWVVGSLWAAAAAWGRRPRLAWFGVPLALLACVALTSGLTFMPWTAARKLTLLVALAPCVGLLLDRMVPGRHRVALILAAAAAAMAAWWMLGPVVARDAQAPALRLAAPALLAAASVLITARLRDDGVGLGASTLALGLGGAAVAFFSASVGQAMNGVAFGVAGATLLLVQLVVGRGVPPGWTGVLAVALPASLMASSTVVLAEGGWWAATLLLLVPLLASFGSPSAPASSRTALLRVTARAVVIAVLAVVPAVFIAWRAAQAAALGT